MRQAVRAAGDRRPEERPLDVYTLGNRDVYVETEVTAMSTGTELGDWQDHARDRHPVRGGDGMPRRPGLPWE